MPFFRTNFKDLFYFVAYVYMCVAYVYVHIYRDACRGEEDVGVPGTGDTGCCDPPEVDSENGNPDPF